MYVLGVIWIPNYLLLLILIGIAIYIYGKWPFTMLEYHGYRGPKAKLFSGNFDLGMSGSHYASWDLTGKQEYGKLFSFYEGRHPAIISFDTDFLKHVLVKDFSHFSDRRDFYMRGKVRHSLLDLHGEEWRRMRSLTTPFFSSNKLRGNIEKLKYCVDNLKNRCDKIAKSGEEFNVKDLLGAYTLEAICCTAFGVKVDSQSDPDHILIRTMNKMMASISPRNPFFKMAVMFPFIIKLLDKLGFETWPKGSIDVLTELMRAAIAERRKSNQERPDFIQALMKAHEEPQEDGTHQKSKPLTEDEMVAQVATFVGAGFDTVATTASMLLYNLANNPEWQEKVLDEINTVLGKGEVTYERLKEMTILDQCLSESQRLHPTLMRLDRKCVEHTSISGFYIPKDTLILVPVWGLHHDPEYWPNPETYDPERFSPENKDKIDTYAFYGFGQGPRNCVGMRLAQIEVKMAIIKVIQNFKVTVRPRSKGELKLAMSFFLEIEGGLWLQLEKRK